MKKMEDKNKNIVFYARLSDFRTESFFDNQAIRFFCCRQVPVFSGQGVAD